LLCVNVVSVCNGKRGVICVNERNAPYLAQVGNTAPPDQCRLCLPPDNFASALLNGVLASRLRVSQSAFNAAIPGSNTAPSPLNRAIPPLTLVFPHQHTAPGIVASHLSSRVERRHHCRHMAENSDKPEVYRLL